MNSFVILIPLLHTKNYCRIQEITNNIRGFTRSHTQSTQNNHKDQANIMTSDNGQQRRGLYFM